MKDFENTPITIFVNLVSMYVPYTSAGKQSVASEEEVVKEIRMALMDVGRKFHRYHSKMRREIEKEARMNALMKYSAELAAAVAGLTDRDAKKLGKALQELIQHKLKIEYKALQKEIESEEAEEIEAAKEKELRFKEEEDSK
jgi:DNA topoisomerase-6 subunit B